MKVLVVRHAFSHVPAALKGAEPQDPVDYKVGDMIRDPGVIASVTAAGQAHFCTPTEVDESFFQPDPEPQPDAPPAKGKAPAAAGA